MSNKAKNYKICVICGKSFPCPPSSKKITCSKECSHVYLSIARHIKQFNNKTRQKISDKAKAQGYTDNLRKGTPSAQKSPNSGRFETNVNAIDWTLKSPEGKIYKCHNLNLWCSKNYELFGLDESEAYKSAKGLRTAKRGERGKIKCNTYKGWRVILDSEDDL